MFLFPWLVAIVVLSLLAVIILTAWAASGGLLRERRLRLARPAIRAVIVLTLIEFVIVLVWGLVLVTD